MGETAKGDDVDSEGAGAPTSISGNIQEQSSSLYCVRAVEEMLGVKGNGRSGVGSSDCTQVGSPYGTGKYESALSLVSFSDEELCSESLDMR